MRKKAAFVSDTQLRGLEERSYLDPDLRGFSAFWFVTVGEQPRIQPSVSWVAKSAGPKKIA
jgi:hypothetical protein